MSDNEKIPEYLKPCPHAEPQAASQLHGVCVFCYRDRLAAKEAELKTVREEAGNAEFKISHLVEERDSLRREVELLSIKADERLKKIWALEQEASRYKEALEFIYGASNESSPIHAIAKAALTPAPSGGAERCPHGVHGTDCYECYPSRPEVP